MFKKTRFNGSSLLLRAMHGVINGLSGRGEVGEPKDSHCLSDRHKRLSLLTGKVGNFYCYQTIKDSSMLLFFFIFPERVFFRDKRK